MMRRRAWVIALTTVILTAALSACAGGGDVASPETPDSTPGPVALSSPLAPPVSPGSSSAAITSPTPLQQPVEPEPEPPTVSGEVIISFDYVRQSGAASNQHAVWIEDMSGNMVRTLYASRWTADGGYRTRPDSIKLWVERFNLASRSAAEVDAVSGATPSAGRESYTWDLTDADGVNVPPGDYMIYVEGTLRWRNYVIYSGVITLRDAPVNIFLDDYFHYEAAARYGALNEDSGENSMIGLVNVRFTPFDN